MSIPTRHLPRTSEGHPNKPKEVTANALRRHSAVVERIGGILLAVVLTVGLLGACGSSSKSTTTTPAAAAASGEATPGTCPTTNTKSFAKTKFVLHAGLAFGAFHRYLYKPLKAGSFSKGAHGRILTFVKAGAAAVYIKHELRLTAGDVQANPTLCKAIAAPLKNLSTEIGSAVSQLRGGNTSGVLGAQSNLGSITSLAKSHGASIVDQVVPSLG